MRALHRAFLSSVLVALTALPLLSGCSVHDSTLIPATPLPDLQPVGLKRLWQRQVTLAAGESLKDAWRVGSSIYLATSQSRVIRLDARSGVLAWSNSLGEANFEVYRPIELAADQEAKRNVLVMTRGESFVFNLITGEMDRDPARVGLSISTNPVLIGNTVCVGGAGRFVAFYLDRLGVRRWQLAAPGDLFDSSPVVVDNDIILATRSGHLSRLKVDNGDWTWKDRKTNGEVTAGLAADSRAVYVPCLDQRVYAFSVDTGGELWQQQVDPNLETPIPAGDIVLVTSENRGTFALAKSNGEIKWQDPGVTQIADVGDSTAWVGDMDGTLKLINLSSGEVVNSALATGVQFYVRNTEDKNVVLVTRAGLVGVFAPIK